MRAATALLLACAAQAALACPPAAEVRQQDLFGVWRAEIEGRGSATLRLSRHPEFGGSFTGDVERGGGYARLAGDIDKGEFTLEESIDGVRVSASWVGRIVEGSCGREIRGTWQSELIDGEPIVPFVLRRR